MSLEDDFRLVGLANCYGTGTRSYNRSAQKREMDRQRKAATERYAQSPRQECTTPLICSCRSFNYPHRLSAHNKLRNESDWRTPEERQLDSEMRRAIEHDDYLEARRK